MVRGWAWGKAVARGAELQEKDSKDMIQLAVDTHVLRRRRKTRGMGGRSRGAVMREREVHVTRKYACDTHNTHPSMNSWTFFNFELLALPRCLQVVWLEVLEVLNAVAASVLSQRPV